MKKILIIATGGTIACSEGEDGLAPSHDANDLLGFIKDEVKDCTFETFQLLNIDSTNMQPKYWIRLANHIKDNYLNFDAFIITHGTDTMAYTSAMLAYMIQNFNKPLVITGSQKPITHIDTDGIKNLLDSVRFAVEDIPGVFIVFNGKVILGTRATKMRTKSDNAFESINYPCIAEICGQKINFINYDFLPRTDLEPIFNFSISSKVFLLKLTPATDPKILDYLKLNYDGVIIESYGSGGIPFEGEINLFHKIKELVDSNIAVVVTTQVILEGSDLSLYQVGQKALKIPVIPAYDMTREAAVTKLMWVLGQTKKLDEVKKLFLTPINYDLDLLPLN